jgi:hypothetical protein
MTTVELKVIFNRKKEKTDKKGRLVAGFKLTTFEMFHAWFDPKVFERGCHYCGLTNNDCKALFLLREKASRGGKRGRRLELDRRDPFLHYDQLENIRWCCYWCNSAKSNFFTESEFKPIAIEIGKVLRNILKEANEGK